MKRICLLLVLAMLFLRVSDPARCEAERKNMDRFFMDEYEDALWPEESETFEIGYLVSRVLDQPEQGPAIDRDVYVIRYDLILVNKSGKQLDNVYFAAHLPEYLQIMLASPVWYNEPVDLGKDQTGALPPGAAYTWMPFVLPEEAGELENLDFSMFYDMVIEITWDGGREIVKLSHATAAIPDGIGISLDTDGPFGEEELSELLAISNERS